jgi:hypothetical protein
MKVNSSSYQHFTNSEHIQFMNDVDNIIIPITPEAIDIAKEYPEFKTALTDEEKSFSIISKSALTRNIKEADDNRGRIYSGASIHIKGLQKHFDNATAEAAYRISVLWDGYGNMNMLSYDQQTAGTYSLIQNLKSEKFAADIELLNLQSWIDALETANTAFENIIRQRTNEQSQKNSLTRMRDARMRTDKAYMTIRNRINAAIIFNGEEKYRNVVLRMNATIDRYNTNLARRRGSNADDSAEMED